MIYLVTVFSTVQNAVLTVEGAARHGARIFVSADSEMSGSTAVERSVAIALTDHGLHDLEHELTISCSPLSTGCGTPGGFATVRLAITVPLPLVPPVLGLETALAVPISAEAAVPFSQFGEDDSE
ncbi:pilus assembly protein [Humidisolicoccus flavus]|uniref:pilus assembly protein n=1 Tax=Humidisolicoccus flavus TaxID=3111414 RepID=UPI0032431B7E